MKRLFLTIAAMLAMTACQFDPVATGPGPTNMPYICTPDQKTGMFVCTPNPNYRP